MFGLSLIVGKGEFENCLRSQSRIHELQPSRLGRLGQSPKAAALLFKRHPDCGGLRLNLMTHKGFDIESIAPDLVKAEVFATLTPWNNIKLANDFERLRDVRA